MVTQACVEPYNVSSPKRRDFLMGDHFVALSAEQYDLVAEARFRDLCEVDAQVLEVGRRQRPGSFTPNNRFGIAGD